MEAFFENILSNLGAFTPIVACLLIVVESIFPILPLFVFITINFLAFGSIWGFIISWFFTCLGCILSFFLFRHKIKNRHISPKTIEVITNLNLEYLTVIIAIPFTPAFLINIACGLSSMSFKKYLIALLIGKVFLVYFWGFIGVSLIESLTNPKVLLNIAILLLLAYLVSLIVNKKIKVE